MSKSLEEAIKRVMLNEAAAKGKKIEKEDGDFDPNSTDPKDFEAARQGLKSSGLGSVAGIGSKRISSWNNISSSAPSAPNSSSATPSQASSANRGFAPKAAAPTPPTMSGTNTGAGLGNRPSVSAAPASTTNFDPNSTDPKDFEAARQGLKSSGLGSVAGIGSIKPTISGTNTGPGLGNRPGAATPPTMSGTNTGAGLGNRPGAATPPTMSGTNTGPGLGNRPGIATKPAPTAPLPPKRPTAPAPRPAAPTPAPAPQTSQIPQGRAMFNTQQPNLPSKSFESESGKNKPKKVSESIADEFLSTLNEGYEILDEEQLMDAFIDFCEENGYDLSEGPVIDAWKTALKSIGSAVGTTGKAVGNTAINVVKGIGSMFGTGKGKPEANTATANTSASKTSGPSTGSATKSSDDDETENPFVSDAEKQKPVIGVSGNIKSKDVKLTSSDKQNNPYAAYADSQKPVKPETDAQTFARLKREKNAADKAAQKKAAATTKAARGVHSESSLIAAFLALQEQKAGNVFEAAKKMDKKCPKCGKPMSMCECSNMEEELSDKQKKIAALSSPKNKLDAGDFKKLRSGHKPMEEEVDIEEGKGIEYTMPTNVPVTIVKTGKRSDVKASDIKAASRGEAPKAASPKAKAELENLKRAIAKAKGEKPEEKPKASEPVERRAPRISASDYKSPEQERAEARAAKLKANIAKLQAKRSTTSEEVEQLFSDEELEFLSQFDEALVNSKGATSFGSGDRYGSKGFDDATLTDETIKRGRGRPKKSEDDAGGKEEPRDETNIISAARSAMGGKTHTLVHSDGSKSSIDPEKGRRINSMLNNMENRKKAGAVEHIHKSSKHLDDFLSGK